MKIFIKAKPGAKTAYVKKMGEGELFGAADGVHFVVAVRGRAIEGKANSAVVKAIAAYLKVPVSRVRIAGGQASRDKILEIL